MKLIWSSFAPVQNDNNTMWLMSLYCFKRLSI